MDRDLDRVWTGYYCDRGSDSSLFRRAYCMTGKSHLNYHGVSRNKSRDVLDVIIDVMVDLNSSPGGVLPYISYIGMCRPKGYGF